MISQEFAYMAADKLLDSFEQGKLTPADAGMVLLFATAILNKTQLTDKTYKQMAELFYKDLLTIEKIFAEETIN